MCWEANGGGERTGGGPARVLRGSDIGSRPVGTCELLLGRPQAAQRDWLDWLWEQHGASWGAEMATTGELTPQRGRVSHSSHFQS